MDALRAHEDLHARLEERELGSFIDAQTPEIGEAMAKLKETPALSVEAAKLQVDATALGADAGERSSGSEGGIAPGGGHARGAALNGPSLLAIGLLDARISRAI